jgi:hypothetical protein
MLNDSTIFEDLTSKIKHKTNNWGEVPTKTDLDDLQKQLTEYQDFANLKGDAGKKNKKQKQKKIHLDKCWAKLESGLQCKRKHKNDSKFCREHNGNNCAFGTISDRIADNNSNNSNNNADASANSLAANQKFQTYTFYIHHIDGIQYFADAELNVYSAESVLSDNMSPQKIGIIGNGGNEIARC